MSLRCFAGGWRARSGRPRSIAMSPGTRSVSLGVGARLCYYEGRVSSRLRRVNRHSGILNGTEAI